jgi:predicted RNA binding protein YcfA (HicA-like mRNA interferase family)
VAVFPSMKADDLLALLQRRPLRYKIVRQSGSHRRLEADGYRSFTFSYSSNRTVPPCAVRKILVQDVGLEEDHALRLLRGVWR